MDQEDSKTYLKSQSNHEEKNSINESIYTCNVFSIGTSKSGRAKCQKCKLLIKDDYRIGKKVPFKANYITHFFHVKCAFESVLTAKLEKNAITSVNDIDGMEQVPDNVRTDMTTLIQQARAMRELDHLQNLRQKLPNRY